MNDLTETQKNIPAVISPAEMLAMAVQQNADLDKLEKLMDLKERYEASEAKKAFSKAVARFRDNCPLIQRTKKAYDSKYAGLAETVEQIKSVMTENGLSHSWRTEQSNGSISVTCCVMHTEGHSECTTLMAQPDTSGSKNSIQAIGSTVSYLERYTLFAILGLSSADMDDDGNKAAPRPATFTPYQYQRVIQLLESGNAFDFICYQKEIGENVFEAIHADFPSGKKSALKVKAKECATAGHAALADMKESILESIKAEDAFLLSETVDDLGLVGKMLVWADMTKEDRAAAKQLLETIKDDENA